jgi:lipid-A-disaccharide synthase
LNTKLLKIGIVVGEASGDLLGAKLIEALRAEHPHIQFEGLGGPAMMAQGFNSLFDIERLEVMGFIEPLLRLPDLLKLRRELFQYFIANKPDVFIGIDAPDFNIGLEAKLKSAGIKTVHYVSPSVWAWRQYRVKKIAKAVDLMLTLLPFEADFYEQHQLPVKYVGHPLADAIPLQIDTIAARRELCLDEKATYIAILPGSRKQEIKYNAEPFLLAALKLWREHPELKFITSHVNEDRYQEFYELYQKVAPDLPLQFFTSRSHDVLAASDFVMVTSGTATLETMLYKKPMVIGYRMSPLTYKIAQWIVKTPYIGLPNLLANELLVPELVQGDLTPDAVAEKINDYLVHPDLVTRLKDQFTELHMALRTESAVLASKAILHEIENA